MPAAVEIAFADSEPQVRACFALMRELRPHLASPIHEGL